MTLESLRRDIDRIDARILSLLDERLEKGLLTRRHKSGSVELLARPGRGLTQHRLRLVR